MQEKRRTERDGLALLQLPVLKFSKRLERTFMRTTMKDIAKECGVSVSAVSLVLSGKAKKGRISESKMEEIRQTARRMNYYLNSAASDLARGQSRVISMVINDIRNSHIAELDIAISRVLQNHGYSVVNYILHDQKEEDQEELVRRIAAGNICALIWAKPFEPSKVQENKRLYEIVDSLGIPVITMDAYDFKSDGMNICYDYEKAGYLAVNYLIGCGHRRIGCIAGNQEYKVTRDRMIGYRQALKEAGISFDEKLVYSGDYTMESGSQALSYLMGQHVTAIFAMNDEMAFGVYRSARSYGIRIPEDLSVVGCDNVPFAEVLETPLTTVGEPTEQMGIYIGEQLCEAIEKHPASMRNQEGKQRRTVYYQPDLYVRGSVKKIQSSEA